MIQTTFLSSLALRIDTYRMNVSGTITMNGKPYTKQELKAMSGYVMQGDFLKSPVFSPFYLANV